MNGIILTMERKLRYLYAKQKLLFTPGHLECTNLTCLMNLENGVTSFLHRLTAKTGWVFFTSFFSQICLGRAFDCRLQYDVVFILSNRKYIT
jgi:hypothetical protein